MLYLIEEIENIPSFYLTFRLGAQDFYCNIVEEGAG